MIRGKLPTWEADVPQALKDSGADAATAYVDSEGYLCSDLPVKFVRATHEVKPLADRVPVKRPKTELAGGRDMTPEEIQSLLAWLADYADRKGLE